MSADALSAEAIAGVDAASIVADVCALPDQLRDALWRVESAGLAPTDAPGGLIVAGMGGSGIGGGLAVAMLDGLASRPIHTVRSYALPAWVTPDTMVLCASYSGNTEETLACYEAAGAVGAPRIVVTTGGQLADAARADGVPVIPVAGALQPRAAVAYMVTAVLEVAALCGAGASMRAELDVAAAHLEGLVAELGPDGPADGPAKALAHALHGTIPVVAGATLTAPIAYRWKTQINENAKIPAFAHELPELDHNELVGWEGAPELGTFSAVFLDDIDLHPRIRRRVQLTRELVSPSASHTAVVSTGGQTRVERMFSLVLLGDLLSVYLAVLRGVDPSPVPKIESLKAALAEG